jgi:ADP-ribosylglycohydrolase
MTEVQKNAVTGAIAGDIIGSIYEWDNHKSKDFPLFSGSCCFTDDTVHTLALAESIITGADYPILLKVFYQLYPDAGYGGRFKKWAISNSLEAYNSWGNGAAMRISPITHAAKSLEEAMALAHKYTSATHDHFEGIRGGQAVAAASFLALQSQSKEKLKEHIVDNFGYDLSGSLDLLRPGYTFDVTCQGTVPVAILAFLESTDYEDAIRNAISVGGDSDTIACITGGIAGAYYGVPEHIAARAISCLDARLAGILKKFTEMYVLR